MMDKKIFWDGTSYIGRARIKNQTLEIKLSEVANSDDTVWFNIVLTVFTKRKDYDKIHQNKTITGLYPFETVGAGLKLFDEMEKKCLSEFSYINVVIFCHWLDNRRRDAYYKILSRRGYNWGRIGTQKAIFKKWIFRK